MKKLLVLLLILGMASTASAVLTAFENGVELTGSIPGTVNVFGSGFTVSEPGTVFVVFTGTVDTETEIKTGGNAGAGLVDQSSFATTMDGILGLTEVTVTEIWQFTFQDDDPFSIFPNGNLASFNAGGSQTIYLQDSTGQITLDTLVPEPMTIALLGLGGLFLMRRRK